MLGQGDSPRSPAEPALTVGGPWLCTRHVGSLWLGHSLWGDLLCWQDGVADQGEESPIGGETGGMSPSIREIPCKMCSLGKHHPGKGRNACTGLLKPCGKNAGRMGVLGMLMVPEQRGYHACWGVWGTAAAGIAQAAGKRCSCMGSLYRFAEPEREAIAGSRLCSCP